MNSALWTTLLILKIMCIFTAASRSTYTDELRPQRPHKQYARMKHHLLQEFESPNTPPMRHSKFSKLDGFLKQYFNHENKMITVEESRINNVHGNKLFQTYSSNIDHDQDHEDNDDDTTIKSRAFSEDENFVAAAEINDYPEQTDSDEIYEYIGKPKKTFPQQKLKVDPPLSLTSRRKIEEWGNREKTDIAFQKQYGKLPRRGTNTSLEYINLEKAMKHQDQMMKEGMCNLPTPTIFKVNEFYNYAHKTYNPPCVRLHRCTNNSGCCMGSKKCLPENTVNVTLYFAVSVNIQGSIGFKEIYEGLTFINHTECKCKKDRISLNLVVGDEQSSHNSLRSHLSERCKCLKPFSSRLFANGSCSCDCFDQDKKCIDFKTGVTSLSYLAKHCIEAGTCTPPNCTYGIYSKKVGRCPRKSYITGEQSDIKYVFSS